MPEGKIDIRDLRDGNFLWLDKAALKLVSLKAGNRGVSVYSWLCYYANIRGQDCFPSMKTLARHCNVSSRTVMRTIKRLESIGIVAIDRTKGKGNVYHLLNAPTSDMGVTRVVTPLSPLPVTPMSPEQDLIEQDISKKTVASLFQIERKPSPAELKALTALFLELKDRIDLVLFVKTYRKKHGSVPAPAVMINVCDQFKAQGQGVRKAWPWFERVVRAEAGLFNAAEQVREHEEIKKQPVSIGHVLSQMALQT